MAQRTRPRTTPRSIIMDSLIERGFSRTAARNILSNAEGFRSPGRTEEQRRQHIRDNSALSSAEQIAVSEIAGTMQEIAPGKQSVADLSEREAREIADVVATSETTTAQFYGRGLREFLLFMHRYIHQGMSFEESARRVGGTIPRRTRRR